MIGTLYGIGVGPGDPELLTLKAIKTIAGCDLIAAPDSGAENQTALGIASEHIAKKPVLSLDLPMINDKFDLQKKRELAAEAICAQLDMGKNVGFLTLGDPMIYSTYSYLHHIVISRGYTAEAIPGVTSFCAAAAALGEPLCEGSQSLHIIPALYDDIESALKLGGTKVLMKSGKKLNEVVALLGKKDINAKLAQRIGMDGQRLCQSITTETDLQADYFSVVIVSGSEGG